MYAIIAEWDSQNRVSRYNYVEMESEAISIIDKLHGVGPDALPLAKQAPNAYYVLMPPAPIGTGLFQHRARFWIADPINKTVSFDTIACHAWQFKVSKQQINEEADVRIDRIFSPNEPNRADRIISEMPEGAGRIALLNKAKTIRTASQALKDSLVNMTPEEILNVKLTDDNHWPE